MQFEVEDLGFCYSPGKWLFRGVSFAVQSGERVGLVGPSGYGKSTLSRLIAGYLQPVEGRILLDGQPLPKRGFSPIQLIYQHPEKALDPHWTMGRSLFESWQPDEAFLDEIGIKREWLSRYPHELSGGEMQRFCIARVLGPQTKFLLADEITTMLDTITQAQIWELLLKQAEQRDLGMLVITHNHALAQRTCTRILDLTQMNLQ